MNNILLNSKVLIYKRTRCLFVGEYAAYFCCSEKYIFRTFFSKKVPNRFLVHKIKFVG